MPRTSSAGQSRPLWSCPSCGRTFAKTNQTHSCGTIQPLDAHFVGKPASVRALFERVLEMVTACGPVTVLSERTRIAFHVRMSFMVLSVRRSGLRGHFVFSAVNHDPRFVKVTTISPRNHVHEFRVTSASDLDAAFQGWVTDAYKVGQQKHLTRIEA